MWRFFLILSISLSVAYADNPCDILTGNQTFAPNPRGCNLYYYCGDNNIAKPGQCPTEPITYHFNFETQSCELPEDVDCTIDDELWNIDCPGIGIAKVPHQYSCSEYSVCLDDQPIDRSCPDGLHFSPYDQECVDPSIANCKNDRKTCQSSDPFVPLFIPNSRNCRAYYICFNNVLHTFSCGEDQVFDRSRNMCVPSAAATCEQTLNPDLQVPQNLTYDCSDVKNGSRIPHPELCKFWFWCVNGRSQLFWCGKDALFDSRSRLCAEQNQTVCANINGLNSVMHDFSDHSEYKIMPASEFKVLTDSGHKDFSSVVQPKLNVLHLKHVAEHTDEKANIENNDAPVETKPEKFYGLF